MMDNARAKSPPPYKKQNQKQKMSTHLSSRAILNQATNLDALELPCKERVLQLALGCCDWDLPIIGQIIRFKQLCKLRCVLIEHVLLTLM